MPAELKRLRSQVDEEAKRAKAQSRAIPPVPAESSPRFAVVEARRNGHDR